MTVGLHPPNIYVGETGTAKGRGVFANAAIKHHDLVEVAPVIVFRAHALPRIVATILFNWEELAKEEPNTRAIALWQSLGFDIVGTVPQAFRHHDLGFVDVVILHRFL